MHAKQAQEKRARRNNSTTHQAQTPPVSDPSSGHGARLPPCARGHYDATSAPSPARASPREPASVCVRAGKRVLMGVSPLRPGTALASECGSARSLSFSAPRRSPRGSRVRHDIQSRWPSYPRRGILVRSSPESGEVVSQSSPRTHARGRRNIRCAPLCSSVRERLACRIFHMQSDVYDALRGCGICRHTVRPPSRCAAPQTRGPMGRSRSPPHLPHSLRRSVRNTLLFTRPQPRSSSGARAAREAARPQRPSRHLTPRARAPMECADS